MSKRAPPVLVAVLLTACASACSYTVALRADAPAAVVDGLSEQGSQLLPAEARVPWTPWKRRPVTVSAPGYRPLQMNLGWRTIRDSDVGAHRWIFDPESRTAKIDVVLIREHGAIGTWSTEDISQ